MQHFHQHNFAQLACGTDTNHIKRLAINNFGVVKLFPPITYQRKVFQTPKIWNIIVIDNFAELHFKKEEDFRQYALRYNVLHQETQRTHFIPRTVGETKLGTAAIAFRSALGEQ